MRKCLEGLILYMVLVYCFSSCTKEPPVKIPETKGVYIVNEGNFNFGTAEVSFYDPEAKQVTNGLFQAANSYALGDVGQSMYIQDSTGYIVVNNSQKIEVVLLPSFQKIRTITIPYSSPRYFLPINDSIAYVSELYIGKIHVLNYLTGDVVTHITVPIGWTERMLRSGNDVLVEGMELASSSTHNSGIIRINTPNHTYADIYKLNEANTLGMVKDKYGRLWVAKDEDTTIHQPAVIYCLNTSYQPIDSIEFNAGSHHPTAICINGGGDKIYYLDNGVYTFSVDGTPTPQLLVDANSRNLYSLGIDPVSDDIYMADALDFIQSSRIYRYDSSGQLIDSFTTGLISGNFAFNHD